jgi:hypothetical protein
MKHEGKRERGGRESQLTSLVIKQEASLFAGEAIFVMGNPGMKSTSVSFKKDRLPILVLDVGPDVT